MSPFALLLAVLVLLLSACATPGHVKTDIWHSLIPAQQDEAQVIEGVLAKLAEECRTRQPASACIPARVVVTWSGMTPQYQHGGHAILVPASALNPSLRVVMAHEIGHSWWADARDDCQGKAKAFTCEQNANVHGAQVLRDGYGYSEADAILMTWAYLVGSVQNGVKPSQGHPDACRELHAFETRVGTTSLYQWQEKAR